MGNLLDRRQSLKTVRFSGKRFFMLGFHSRRMVVKRALKKLRVQGPRMVRDVFRLAKENAPAIIFIDEVDAIATARFDAQTGADRQGFLSTCMPRPQA